VEFSYLTIFNVKVFNHLVFSVKKLKFGVKIICSAS